MSQSHIRLAEVLEKLPLPATPKWKHGVFDIEIMRCKGLSVVLYAPKIEDFQTTHDQDELYFIVSGTSKFLRGTEWLQVGPGDALFVPAYMHHRFEEFSTDFVTWAVLW